jgi:DNA-binding XRE family transcriptional regulator
MNNKERQSLIDKLTAERNAALVEFSARIRAHRGEMLQRDFAAKLSVHIRSVCAWEIGQSVPCLLTLHRLAYKLDDHTLVDIHQHADRTTHNVIPMLIDLARAGLRHTDIAHEIGCSHGALCHWRAGGAMRQDYYQLLIVLHGERLNVPIR